MHKIQLKPRALYGLEEGETTAIFLLLSIADSLLLELFLLDSWSMPAVGLLELFFLRKLVTGRATNFLTMHTNKEKNDSDLLDIA